MNRPENEETIERMLSAYLDGELTQADNQRVQLHLASSEEFRRELEEMTALRGFTSELHFRHPPDEVMNALESRLSVRAPRQFGWAVVVAAVAAWVLYAVILMWRDLRWPTIPEFLTGGLISGFVLVFVSVLRQRILERPHDRYRKVRR